MLTNSLLKQQNLFNKFDKFKIEKINPNCTEYTEKQKLVLDVK